MSQLDQMIATQGFRFDRLVIEDIDNAPVSDVYGPEVLNEEICLFCHDVSTGDRYLDILHTRIQEGMSHRQGIPIVRFADGEYAFYNYDLGCNGLYQQAESLQTIKQAMSLHLKALKNLAVSGILAPLLFPGNSSPKSKGIMSLFRRSKRNAPGSIFVDFLFTNQIRLTSKNYVPFYAVYAYLTSKEFASLVDGKKLCILSSGYNRNACLEWFRGFSSYPDMVFTEIPDSYVATQWPGMKQEIFKNIPPDIDICLVGAGVGALLVCADVAQRFSVPAIDAGHVLNMMNNREDKSNGPRLYTLRKI